MKVTVVRKNSRIIPLNLKVANRFVSQFHRHNKKVAGAKFAIGLNLNNELIGVAIAGRPLARLLDNGKTIEILRVCVKDGFKNANSLLYARIRRISELMGYRRVITYTLQTESGSSLRAIGATPVPIKKHTWKKSQPNRPFIPIYAKPKIRWEIPLTKQKLLEVSKK